MKHSKYLLSLVTLCCSFAVSQGAFASTTAMGQEFTDQMVQLEQIQDQQTLLRSDSTFNRSETTLDVQIEMQDIYITGQQAKDMGLQKVRTFNVYSAVSKGQLSSTITKMIHKDNPTYFSVDVFSNRIGDSDTIEYVAKVSEYR